MKSIEALRKIVSARSEEIFPMRKVLLYNPAIGSLNLGDQIIMDAVVHQLEPILKESFVAELSTHTPVGKYGKYIRDFDLKFVCGSNLIRGKMNRRFRQWDISLTDASLVGPCILLGVGWWQYGDDANIYTKKLYKKVLSSQVLHSVRDSYTERQFKKMGIDNIINTACPTMWNLTEDHCAEIPKKKAKEVMCTLTDYNMDPNKDACIVETLCRNYEKVYYWIQGSNDYNYFESLNIKHDNIEVIEPTIKSYNQVLARDVDYVGTRLHGGLRALQKQKRTLILAIDNRAVEMKEDFNIPCLHRNDYEALEKMIKSSFETKIRIPVENIQTWKNQYKTFLER